MRHRRVKPWLGPIGKILLVAQISMPSLHPALMVAEGQAADPGEPGVIRGWVVDLDDLAPISFHVSVREQGRPQAGILRLAITDKDGRFRLEGLRPGVYDIFVSDSEVTAFLPPVAKVVRLTYDSPVQTVILRLKSGGSQGHLSRQ